jgi:hypothetical protein
LAAFHLTTEATQQETKSRDLDFEQIEMLANFSDYAVDYPKLSFEEIAKKLGVDFRKAKNGKLWEKECREAFDRERA